jgi:hypothetical protein
MKKVCTKQVCYSDILESLYTKPGSPGEEVGIYSDFLPGSLGTLILGEETEEEWLDQHFENTVAWELENAGYTVVGEVNGKPWDELFYVNDRIEESLQGREVRIRRVYASDGLYTRHIWVFLWDSIANRWLTSRQLIQPVGPCLEFSTSSEVEKYYGYETDGWCPCNHCRMKEDLVEWTSNVFYQISFTHIEWSEAGEIKPY